jgi:hypothetical protein
MKISSAVTKLLNEIEHLIPKQSEEARAFAALLDDVSGIRERLDEPLRVAVVGMVNAGKSTLFNAILGKKVLFTDVQEATYTACWFRYSDTHRLIVHFADNTEMEVPFNELKYWSSWEGRKNKNIDKKYKWLTIMFPSPLLKMMDLIDTAGLNAATGENSDSGITSEDVQNTLDLLKSAEVEAFIYAYKGVPQVQDLAILKKYNSSALNAVGVLTRADDQLKPDDDPIKLKFAMCERHSAELKGEVYNVLPTAARMAEGIVQTDETVMSILKKLATADTEILRSKLISEDTFLKNGVDGVGTTTEERKKVIGFFGKNGLFIVTQAVKNGLECEELINRIYAISGVDKVRERVHNHFGNHAYLLRLEFVLRRIEKLIGTIRRENRNNPDNAGVIHICNQIRDKLNEWQRREELLFMELSILRSYYTGAIIFTSPELEEQFMQITGEYGSNCEARLGYGEGSATVREMKNEVERRIGIWHGISNDLGAPAGMVRVAEVVVRICNELRKHLDVLSGYSTSTADFNSSRFLWSRL